jgi:hypothetical protein
MKKLTADLEFCYGIKRMSHEFDFSDSNSFAIYAPNGVMKSSFAKTLDDFSKGLDTKDKIFPKRVSKRILNDEQGNEVSKENILVIQTLEDSFANSEKTSTLLVKADLRKEYEELHKNISELKNKLFKSIKNQSGTKKDIEKEISQAFTPNDKSFFTAIKRIHEEVLDQKEAPFEKLQYDTIFDEKVIEFLETKDFKAAIADYIKKYNELLEASTYFKKGVFNYYNASNIAKSLAENGFFKAKHTITLNSGEALEVSDEKQLSSLIEKEKDAITNDAELKKKFAEISKLLEKNVKVRDFHDYLSNNDEILPFLSNIAEFKDHIWKSYLVSNKEAFDELVVSFKAAEKRRIEIEAQAAGERTQWEIVIEEFNERFHVPFKLIAKNKVAVMLGEEPILSLGFEFQDGGETASIDRKDLLDVLSTGEKKALYILNVLFEIAVRKATGAEHLIIVDDIADSFDYKNKYAIIQYLKEIHDDGNFKLIVLSHNFDFFRTVESRFVSYKKCVMVLKDKDGIKIVPASGIKNIFVNDWKGKFGNDNKKMIASIPFMRNLIEYTLGEADADFSTLTSLLHWKPDTHTIDSRALFEIYNKIFSSNLVSPNPTQNIFSLVCSEADSCLNAQIGINFENKIVLAIASRLVAEKFIVEKINDPTKTSGINSCQTPVLVGRYRKEFPLDNAQIKHLDKVVLMTPENIHLNSFMYEPILDMSDEHLRQLYSDIKTLH